MQVPFPTNPRSFSSP
uniref:Two-component response regulator ORR21 n=1 Tax=Rhizophora mucronata TaxID=61149 RepID=A0A2P2NCF9_RHIMU